jgi:hypothetical protein
MPQPSNFDTSAPPPVATRRCPVCGEPMFLSLIEPTYQHGYDVRTFECAKCAYAEIALINFNETRGDDHTSAGAIQHETIKDPEKDNPTEEEKIQ